MKNKLKQLFTFSVLCCSTQALADASLNRLIKAQDDIDKSTRQETKVAKKDIYSSVENSALTDLDFPYEQNCIDIHRVVIENNFLNDSSIEKLSENAAGRCLGILGIQKLALDLQDYLINAGYVTTRVEIPDQDLSSNTLILNVAAGRIEEIIIKDNDVRTWILPFKNNDILNLRDIEQGLEVLQKVPGLDVKISIEPGDADSYSNVAIDTNRTKNWNVRAWYNNWGDDGTGKQLIGSAGYLYNLAKMNDVFYLSGTSNTEMDGRYKNISTYYSIPYGYWDYELFYSNSESKQQIGSRVFDLNYIGKSQYLSLKGSRTVYRDQDKKITATAELIKRKVNYKLNDIELVLQKRNMTNLRFGLNYKQNFDGALLDTTLSYQRFLHGFGAEKTADMKFGDVSPDSHVFNWDLNYLKLINIASFNAYYDGKLGMQYSPGELTLQDQFTIGSRWSVRGFENGIGLDGNKGFYIQNTINVMTGIKDLEWYAGIDYGQIWGNLTSGDGYNHKQLMGTATGLRGSIGALGYDVSVSKPLIYPNALDVDKLSTHFNISYQF